MTDKPSKNGRYPLGTPEQKRWVRRLDRLFRTGALTLFPLVQLLQTEPVLPEEKETRRDTC